MRINNPKTDEDFKAMLIWNPGSYFFEIFDAKEKTSKSGNEMIELILKIYDGEKSKIIFDYLMDANNSFGQKLLHFCQCIGIEDNYKSQEINCDMIIGKSGSLDLIITKGKEGYPDKNTVKDYLIIKKPEFDDALPF